jgi:hypothetical protein
MRAYWLATILAGVLPFAAPEALHAQIGDDAWNAEGVPYNAPYNAASSAPAAEAAAKPPSDVTAAKVKEKAPAVAAPVPSPVEPAAGDQPHTELLDAASGGEHDPLLEPKPLPPARLSLIGGVVRKVDTLRNRLTVAPFGGGPRCEIAFDERSRILRDGRETTVLAIHPGDRVHVDTQALGAQIFARTIQVESGAATAQARGQVLDASGGEFRMMDRMSGETVRISISPRTKVESHGIAVAAAEIHPGALVDVIFAPGAHGEAQSVSIQASPGQDYTFAGILTNIDISAGVLALDNRSDGNNYELYFDPLTVRELASLVVGAPVSIIASFDGRRYRANSIRVTGTERSQR